MGPAHTTPGLQGLTEAQARERFWILDADGLITKSRQGLTAVVEPFARLGETDGEGLLDVVKRVGSILPPSGEHKHVLLPRQLCTGTQLVS